MADLSFIVEEIKNEWAQEARDALSSVSKSNVNYIKQIRSQIIREWFAPFSGTSFSQLKIQEVRPSFHVNGVTGKLTFDTWTDTDLIDPDNFPSAVRWTGNWGGDPVEMVSHLVFDEGIIGLPLHSTIEGYNGPGWDNGTNLHFHQKTPLEQSIFFSEKWNNIMDKIENEIISKIN